MSLLKENVNFNVENSFNRFFFSSIQVSLKLIFITSKNPMYPLAASVIRTPPPNAQPLF